MSLKNASLILKSSDLFDNTPSATVLAYYYTTTQLVVCGINGNIPSSVFIKKISTGTPSAGINGYGYGTIALNTATTATTAHSTVNMEADGQFLKMPTATTTSSTVTINDNIMTLATANTDIVVGQFITGYHNGVYIPDNTIVVSKISTYRYQLSNGNIFITGADVSFWTPPDINYLDGVFATGYAKGTAIIYNTPLSSYANGLYYIMNISQTVVAKDVNFYETQQIDLFNNDVTNAYHIGSNGTCNQYRTSMTWNGINLRTLLGDMYNDYDLFNLSLNFISTAVPPDEISTDADNLNVIVKMSGLPFINQTYDVSNKCNRSEATICSFTFDANNSVRESFYDTIATFGKNQDLCNITIHYERIIDSQDPSTLGTVPPSTVAVTSPFPQIVFNFDIFGVVTEEGNRDKSLLPTKYSKNGNRMLT